MQEQKAVSLYEVLREIRNFFSGFCWTCQDEPIQAGDLSLDRLEAGDYYLVEDSGRNDGLHIQGAGELTGDRLTGYVTLCLIPNEVLALHREIVEWQEKNADAVVGLYSSETFGGYTYTRRAGENGWQTVFANRLNAWRQV